MFPQLHDIWVLVQVLACWWWDQQPKAWGRFKKTYELLNLRALKFSPVNKIHIFQCMGKIFCVEFQRYPLKFHTKYLTHTLKDTIFIQHWNFKSSYSGRQNQRPIVPDEWHNHTGRVAVTVDLSDGRVAIIEQNTKQSNYLKLRISHTPDTISESWKLLWREQVISHM